MEIAATTCKQCGALLAPNQFDYCCVGCATLANFALHKIVRKKNSEFAYLDQPEFRKIYSLPSHPDTVRFHIQGMHCSTCINLLEKMPELNSGVLESIVNFGKSTLTLRLTSDASLAEIADLIVDLGYKPSPISDSDDYEQAMQKENRQFLMRIGVAAASAGNIMLFAISVYGGLSGKMANQFNWISFFIFLPFLFYSAVPFYQGAWNSLKYRVISIDLPIVMAMWAGFALSTYNLIRGEGGVYFDSLASFLFLILCSRYLLKRMQQKYLGKTQLSEFIKVDKILIHRNNEKVFVPLADIQVGDVVEIERGQQIPCDGVLLSDSVPIDLSMLTGESLPRTHARGMQVFAGTKVLSQVAVVKVTETGAKTRIGQILSRIESAAAQKAGIVSITDRAAQILIVTVFSIAAIFFLFYSQINVREAFERALALLIVACPCAMAFGTPLALGLAVRRASKNGILIKSADVFEKILNCKQVYFDKTGTLTHGQLDLVSMRVIDESFQEDQIRSIVLGLESESQHPIAFAFRAAWPKTVAKSIDNIVEKTGVGVGAEIQQSRFEVKGVHVPGESVEGAHKVVALFCNESAVAEFVFSDPVRIEAASVIRVLRRAGYQVGMLSGDHALIARNVGMALGLTPSECFAELTPERKLSMVEQTVGAIMVGDGVNDALALQKASVGVAVRGSVDLSMQVSDVYFARQGLGSLVELVILSRKALHVVKRNLALSVVYNSVAGILALCGFVNPLVAAVLMPMSSGFIVLSSIWGLKE